MATKKADDYENLTIGQELVQKYKSNPFVFIGTVIILVITIVAFVFVPALTGTGTGFMGSASDLTFGSYNGTPISYVVGNHFDQAYQSLENQYRSNITDQNAEFMNQQIWYGAFRQAAVWTGMLDEMKQAGYTAPTEYINEQVAKMPQFQVNGAFSATKYQQLSGTRRTALWNQTKEDITASHYMNDLSDLRVSENEKNFVGTMASPQRSFDMAIFPLSAYPDSEVAAYAKDPKNSALFKVTHLAKITITSSEADAKKILDEVKKGTTSFEDAAKNNSKDNYASKSGDMGIRMNYELSYEIPDEKARAAVVALAKDAYSDVIKVSDSSWAFFKALDAPKDADTTDSAQLKKIRSYIMSNERGKIEDYEINQAKKFNEDVKATNFDTALANHSMVKKSFGPLPVNYGSSPLFPSITSFGIDELSGAATSTDFWKTAFTTAVKTTSLPIVLGNNILVLYPTAESAVDADKAKQVQDTYPYILYQSVNQDISAHFLDSKKFKDNFFKTYSRLFRSGQ